jgi:hypothetical protein
MLFHRESGSGSNAERREKELAATADERKLFIFNWPFSLHTRVHTKKALVFLRLAVKGNFCIETFEINYPSYTHSATGFFRLEKYEAICVCSGAGDVTQPLNFI